MRKERNLGKNPRRRFKRLTTGFRSPRVEALEDRRLLAADGFEPNNSFAAATVLTSAQNAGLTIHQSGTDQDWYKWTVSSGVTALRVDALFTGREDLVLELYDSSQNLLVDVDTTTDNERASIEVTSGQVVYIHVYEFFGTRAADYDLNITEIRPDALESNQTRGTATNLDGLKNSLGDYSRNGLTIHEFGDQDWYKYTAATNGTLTVGLNFQHDDGDIDLSITDADGQQLAGSKSVSDNEQTALELTAGQQVFIQVSEAEGLEQPDYDLSVNFGSPPTIFDPSYQAFTTGFFNSPNTYTFKVADGDTNLDFLVLSGYSTDQGIVANENIVFGGSGANRTITISPSGPGLTDITITVNDGDGGIAEDTFGFGAWQLNPNDPPTISSVPNQTTNEDTAKAVSFTIDDNETPAGSLSLSAFSSDQSLVPNGSIAFSGSGNNRTATITPALNYSGETEITITVADGNGGTASSQFTLTVNPVVDPATNDPPFFNPIADQTVSEDSGSRNVTITNIGPGGGPDEASQTVTLSATSSNPFIVPNPTVSAPNGGNATLTFAPRANRFRHGRDYGDGSGQWPGGRRRHLSPHVRDRRDGTKRPS